MLWYVCRYTALQVMLASLMLGRCTDLDVAHFSSAENPCHMERIANFKVPINNPIGMASDICFDADFAA
jgi:hypothetical protein